MAYRGKRRAERPAPTGEIALGPSWFLRMWAEPDGRVGFFVAASLGLSCLMGLALHAAFQGEQVFALYGLIKKAVLPLIYALAIVTTVAPYRWTWRSYGPPLWWWLMGASLVTGIVWSIFSGEAPSVISFIQDCLLMGGFLLLFHFGSIAPDWRLRWQNLFVFCVCASGLVAMTIKYEVGPFVAIVGPAVMTLIYGGLRGERLRALCLVTGVATAVIMVAQLMAAKDVSTSVVTQAVACAGLTVLCLLPRWCRGTLAVVGVVGAGWFLYQDGTVSLMGGHWQGVTDVTLAQRGCEAEAVLGAVRGPTLEPLLGLAPGGTVNLVHCPDFATLAAAGRDLHAVDDVHFATSWILMKCGAIGVVWLALMLLAIIGCVVRVVSQARPRPFDVLLLLCLVAGLLSALPAATNLFSNPLMPLSLGILWSRIRSGFRDVT